jgi:peptidoglycan hydrolase CwlO-like protein
MAERSRDIAKIQITMAIDEERGAIEEMERSLRTEESRIAAAQDSIKKLNAKITASRGRIGELEQNYAAKDGS